MENITEDDFIFKNAIKYNNTNLEYKGPDSQPPEVKEENKKKLDI